MPVNDKQVGRNVAASMAAAAAASAVAQASAIPALGVIKGIQKIGNLPADKIEIMHKAAEQAIKDTGLAAKGVSIEYLKAPQNPKGIKAIFMGPVEQIREGLNACFVNAKSSLKDLAKYQVKPNTIYMPEKGISYAAFHEIGHAMNANLTKWGTMLQKMRTPGMKAAGLIALYGAFSSKSEPKDGKNLTKGQKVNNFIRNNAGKLAFGAMVPMLFEEAMATIKGNGLAKKLLSPDMFKTVAKGNAVAYMAYLLSAAGLGLGAWTAVKVKDHFTAKKAA